MFIISAVAKSLEILLPALKPNQPIAKIQLPRARNGILLTGGGALVKGVEEFIHARIKVPVKVVSNPLTCVAEGSKYLLKNRGDYLVNPLKL